MINYGSLVFGWIGSFLGGSSFIWIFLGVAVIIPVGCVFIKSVVRSFHHV